MSALISEKQAHFSQTFVDADLSFEEMEFVEFEDCTFRACNFSEATFKLCKFIDCLFLKSNLSVVDFNQSKLSNVTFDQCKLIGIDWTRISWSAIVRGAPITFTDSILNDGSFFGLALEELVAESCQAHTVDFREGDFNHANFSKTDFMDSLFNETNLSYADFTDASNYQIDVYYNKVNGARFCRIEALSLLESLEIELVD